MSEKSFHEKIKEFNADERETHPFKDYPRWKRWSYGAVLFGTPVIQIILLLNGQALLSVLIFSITVVLFLGVTEIGRAFVKLVNENMENDPSDISETDERRICSNCGWQNPNHNNYCNDCGEQLGTEE